MKSNFSYASIETNDSTKQSILYSKRDENTDELIFKNIILPVNKI
jgi:hypothetical protein